jgi:hypothetical protein
MTETHVVYFEELQGVRATRSADIFIGVLLIISVITGIAGNISAAIYFWKKRKSSLPDLLYTIISISDIFTSIVSILMIPTLFNSRLPTLFESLPICGAFALLFNHLHGFSMFMVMLISVTRAIAILAPFYEINRERVIAACIAFEIFWIILDATFLGTTRLKIVYHAQPASCGLISGSDIIAWDTYVIIYLSWMIAGSIAVLISFVFSLRAIAVRKRSEIRSPVEKRFMKVSVTITLFTALFLLCNLPIVVIQASANITYFIVTDKYKLDNASYGWYGLLMTDKFLLILNAATNPCLYLTRMGRYRLWFGSTSRRFFKSSITKPSHGGEQS